MANRLAKEQSPYLLQHADNPVDWFPWGREAMDKAAAENKPIFLSVGYATCHWCHVMAHESFEDPEVAEVLNQNYIPVKVDREERPDLDQVYMAACQALTGQGGWPLSVFLTPEGKPFYAGTYFPKTSRYGRPGFIDLLNMLAEKWQTSREVVNKAAEQLTGAIKAPTAGETAEKAPGREALENGIGQLMDRFDRRYGGFGAAPKFPTPHNLGFLLRWHHRTRDDQALAAVEKTLEGMAGGGLFDHIGFGFHRYSVDEKWLAPHFEKMLYDQALLTLAYLEAWQVSGREEYARVGRKIITYVLRDMTSPEGGFYAAEDADSEGREGRFYLWRPEEIIEELGEELGGLFCRYYDVTEAGNFEDALSIPHVNENLDSFARKAGLPPDEVGDSLEKARGVLFERREKRIHPLKDDKILTAWNGLMIAALARAARTLEEDIYSLAAARAVDFILTELKTPSGRLMRRYRNGQVEHPGFLEDYAFMVWGLLEMYETTFEVPYLNEAVALTRVMIDLFWDREKHGFYFSGRENENLILKKKETYDGAIPSGNSVAVMNMMRLGLMTGLTEFEEKADQLLKAFANEITHYPLAHTNFLMAVDFMLGPTGEIVIAEGDDPEEARAMVRAVNRRFMPEKVVMYKFPDEKGEELASVSPFVKEMGPFSGRSTFYLCRDYACGRPLTDSSLVGETLDRETT